MFKPIDPCVRAFARSSTSRARDRTAAMGAMGVRARVRRVRAPRSRVRRVASRQRVTIQTASNTNIARRTASSPIDAAATAPRRALVSRAREGEITTRSASSRVAHRRRRDRRVRRVDDFSDGDRPSVPKTNHRVARRRAPPRTRRRAMHPTAMSMAMSSLVARRVSAAFASSSSSSSSATVSGKTRRGCRVGASTTTTTTGDVLEEIARANGGVAYPIVVGTNAHGVRGAFATRDVAKGEAVLERGLDGANAVMDDPREDARWSRQLGRRLIRLTRDVSSLSSLMRAYVECLPKERETIGLANDEASVEALRATWDDKNAKEEMLTFAKQIESSFALESAMDDTLTMDEWRWAMAMVHSRTFRIEDEYGRRPTRRAMIPGADLLNHSSVDANCDWSSDGETFVISAVRDIKAGEEFTLSYGSQCDRHFMLFYGFVPEPNPHNKVRLFSDGKHALDWYQALCGVDELDDVWDREKKRIVATFEKKYCVYRPDKNGLRRCVAPDGLFLGAQGVVDEALIMLLNEMSGDEDMAIAAIRARAAEVIDLMESTTDRIEQALRDRKVSPYNVGLMKTFRERKVALLRHVA